MIKKSITIMLILLIPALTVYSYSLYQLFEYLEGRENRLDDWKGKDFPAQSFIDINNNKIDPEFRVTDFRVIDFWYVGCPSCIGEMKEFESLLSGSDNRLTIYSFSADKHETWQRFVTDEEKIKNKELKFLAKPNPSWIHLFPSDQKDNNDNSFAMIKEKFGVTRYPTYFVLDEEGKIITVTNNLKKFVAVNLQGKSGYLLFIQNLPTWQYKKKALVLFLLAYSAITIALFFLESKVRKGKLAFTRL